MPDGHMAEGNTNKNHTINHNTVTEKTDFQSTSSKKAIMDPLALQLAREMDDIRNLAYYERVVRTVDPGILLRARGEVLEERRIKKCRGAMFAYLVKKYAAYRGKAGYLDGNDMS